LTTRRRIPAAGASYSNAVVIDGGDLRWIYIAGQTPGEREGAAIPTDLGGQADACFAQIGAILEECGARPAHVVQITVYLTDLADYAAFAEARARFFGAEAPASAAVGVASLLDGVLVEIAAVAVV
jgi:2-iminobutanoate/2-iminopropanoate deaminase